MYPSMFIDSMVRGNVRSSPIPISPYAGHSFDRRVSTISTMSMSSAEERPTMTTTPSPQRANEIKRSKVSRHDDNIDIEAVLEENDRLRGLVVQLSRLVIRNVSDHQ
jgi:hypothetical protein